MTFKEYRKRNKITQKQLAEYLGVKVVSITQAEQRGGEVPAYHLLTLARLEKDLSEFKDLGRLITFAKKKREQLLTSYA